MRKRSVGRPRDADPAETRRNILAAAEECFAADGFAGATTREVAARAGVNVATLHYHFGSKEGLYRAALAAAAAALPEIPEAPTPPERLAATVAAFFELGWARPALARLALLDRLAGPARGKALAEDPRAALLARTIADAAPPRCSSASGTSSGSIPSSRGRA